MRILPLCACVVAAILATTPARALTEVPADGGNVRAPAAAPDEPAPLPSSISYTSRVPGAPGGFKGQWRARANVRQNDDDEATFTAVEVPLALGYGFEDGSTLRLEAPLRLTHANGGRARHAETLRLTARVPVTDRWRLDAAARAGLSGVIDEATADSTAGLSLQSRFDLPVGEALRVSLQTTAEVAAGRPLDRDRGDGWYRAAVRNRLDLSLDTGLVVAGGDLTVSAAATDHRWQAGGGAGWSDDLSLSLATRGAPVRLSASARLGAAEDTRTLGLSARLSARF